LGALGHAGKLQVFDHATTQIGDRTEIGLGRHGMPPLMMIRTTQRYWLASSLTLLKGGKIFGRKKTLAR
jgi:hypothetical protein